MKIVFATLAALLITAAPALAHDSNGSSSSSSSSSSSYAGNRNSQTVNDRLQAPGVGGIGLTSSGVCPVGSFGFGGSFPGGGLNLAFTRGDTDCRNVYLMQATGFSRAVQRTYVLQNIPAIAAAAQPAAAPVRGGSARPVKTCNQWRGGVIGGVCLY